MRLLDKASAYIPICLSIFVMCMGVSSAYANYEIKCEAILADESQSETFRTIVKNLDMFEADIPTDLKVIKKHNSNVLASLSKLKIEPTPGRITAITGAEALMLFEKVMSLDPVRITTGGSNIYDPWNNEGFCFGRAMAVHLLAIKYGVNKESIRKLWVLGNLSSGGNGSWRYHTAAAIKSTNGHWYVLDPILNRVVTANEWYNIMYSSYSVDKRMLLYDSDGNRQFPVPGKYTPMFTQPRDYERFYRDLFKALKAVSFLSTQDD